MPPTEAKKASAIIDAGELHAGLTAHGAGDGDQAAGGSGVVEEGGQQHSNKGGTKNYTLFIFTDEADDFFTDKVGQTGFKDGAAYYQQAHEEDNGGICEVTEGGGGIQHAGEGQNGGDTCADDNGVNGFPDQKYDDSDKNN